MSSSHCLWHAIGRVLAWVTLLFAVDTGHYPVAAGIGRTVWRAKLLGVLYSTADIFGFIQTTSTPGRFFWGRMVLLFHDLAPSEPHWN